MGLGFIRDTYQRWGAEDPFYAVLTRHNRAGNRWDPEEFFAHGRAEIAGVMDYLDSLGIDVRGGSALDFGCGVGRLSQALADHMGEVVGVDIAESMVDAARAHNRHGERVRYLVNTRPDLSCFRDASFDLVYSNITLQHIPPRYARVYIREFLRVVRPHGCALFQMRSGPRIEPGTLRALFYRMNREHLRHVLQRLKGRLPYEIHFIAREQVEEIVARAGGTLADVVELGGRRRRNYRYCVVGSPKEAASGHRAGPSPDGPAHG
ncbi:MAG TPA: class I SAM-dependent methyltransferase [Longimicrobiales bacterium]|jgi:ubiquinone/menaquinone biosynthesis C-methylase UbiE